MYLTYKKSREIKSLGRVIEYSITSTLDSTNQIVYGISIKMFNINNYSLVEEEHIKNLTHSLRQIRELITILYNNTVTPCETIYVIDDYISSNDNFKFDEDEEVSNITA